MSEAIEAIEWVNREVDLGSISLRPEVESINWQRNKKCQLEPACIILQSAANLCETMGSLISGAADICSEGKFRYRQRSECC